MEVFTVLLKFDYKTLLINLGYIYYFTIFFILTRVLIYFGLTLISLINTKHTTSLKKNSVRPLLAVFMKFYSKSQFKVNFLRIVAFKCL